jgi:hypothetical protein
MPPRPDVSKDADADIVEILIHKEDRIALLFRQGVAFVTTSFGVEQVPAGFRGLADCVFVALDETVEWGIE